ncbi:DnaB-like helicase C-terminal domain-containing protein [Phyllobacterium myrsinacearum]|uniref:Replicative DNA helicase n=1 Tax=Phyllobacterium myrsinacearum TaxID=28101 RepID=A0A839EWS4_9HYPH|nr:replicative DNA helicase [Phyllobacterium myrsinacearum]
MSEVEELEAPATETTETEATKFDFDNAFQRKVAALTIRDTKFAQRTKDLIKPEYFTEDAIGTVVSIVHNHVKDYKAVPDLSILPTIIRDAIRAKKIRSDLVEGVKEIIKFSLKADLSNPLFVTNKVVDFARHRAIEQAMVDSIPLLEKGDFKAIEALQKKAHSVGAQADGQDYDYFEEIESRTKLRDDFKHGRILRRGITTGVSELDAHLYHGGWGRQEMSLLMGAAKSGKTLGLGEFSKNASLAGHNCFYASCEVSCEIISDRLDAALSETAMRLLKDDYETVKRKIKAAQARAGKLLMRNFASGALKPSQLHRIIDQLRADGILIDLITVDYADIMAAEYRSDNLIDNMRAIYIDLRAIAFEFDAAMLTATQTNREGAKASTAKATDVAEDFNKIRTADVVISINASEEERKSNETRLFFAAARNSEDGFTLRFRQDREQLRFIKSFLGKE